MDQLTAQLQLALADAQSLAMGHDNPVIEPTHLMVALLDQSGGIVRHLLAKIDVSLHRLRSTLCESMDQLPKALDVESGDVPIGNDLSSLLNYTETVAKRRGEKHISSEIFVLAAIQDQGVLGTVLAEAGLTEDRIELAIIEMLAGQGVNDQKVEVQGQARDSRTASSPERSKLESVIGELRELANAIESDQQFPLARRVVGQGEHAAAARRGRHSSPSPTRGDVETVG
jgi:ATP-dependent Clp protease ATP-binding subunit ClpB